MMPGQDGRSLPFLPMWFEGETLYSWAAHFHELQGKFSEKESGLLVFGRGHAAKLHEIPTGIAHFVALTHGQLGSLTEIMAQRTVLCEVRPFLTAAFWESLQDQFLDDKQAVETHPMRGLREGGMGKVRPLRYCCECVNLELSELGTSYWHLLHQLNGGVACLKHQRPLESFNHRRSVWLLPHHRSHMDFAPKITEELLPSALLLSQLSATCSSLKPIHVPAFSDAATRCILELGVETPVPRLSGAALAAWFAQTRTSQVATACYPDQPKLHSGNWIAGLLRNPRKGHPIQWLLLWAAILENLPEKIAIKRFVHAASGQLVLADQAEFWPELSEKNSFSAPARMAQVILESTSIREAAAKLCVTHGTVKRWLVLDTTLNFQWRMKQAK